MYVVDKLIQIQNKLPRHYEILVRSNKCDNTFCSEGDWFVHLIHEAGDFINTHEVNHKTIYKKYGNDLEEMLYDVLLITNNLQ